MILVFSLEMLYCYIVFKNSSWCLCGEWTGEKNGDGKRSVTGSCRSEEQQWSNGGVKSGLQMKTSKPLACGWGLQPCERTGPPVRILGVLIFPTNPLLPSFFFVFATDTFGSSMEPMDSSKSHPCVGEGRQNFISTV